MNTESTLNQYTTLTATTLQYHRNTNPINEKQETHDRIASSLF